MAKKRTAKIDELKPDKKNRRKHNRKNMQMIESSIRAVGAARSIVIDEKNNILAGSGTVKAAEDAGIKKVKIVDADGETIIAVRRSGLTKKQKRQLALFDNRSSELAEWDLDQLQKDFDSGLGFDGIFTDKELKELSIGFDKDLIDSGPEIDRARELQKKWGVKKGQMWQLGDHRIICGDCTDEAVVARLMGKEQINVMISDPPYNLNIEYESHDDKMSIETYIDWLKRWHELCKEHIDLFVLTIGKQNMKSWFGFAEIKEVGVWIHHNGVSGGVVSNLSLWEPIIFIGDFSRDSRPSNLYEYELAYQSEIGKMHPVPKQIALWTDLVKHYSDTGNIVRDDFLGSGTTLIACENLNRKCRGIEIEPKYVAVTLERWHQTTGEEPVLISG